MKSITSSFEINALQEGKKEAFEEVYNNLFNMLFCLAMGYVGQREIALEMVQDAFVKLWENRSELRKSTNIKNYLYTITKNNCLNHLRHQEIINRGHRDYLIPELKYQQEALTHFPDSFVKLEELMEEVDRAINLLPNDIAETFRLSRFGGLTYADIAKEQKISTKTVEARISKALLILRRELKDYLPIIELLFMIRF
ncbi:RNA polymerase sigma-70 factor [Thermophagus sp. OGC60D27]|uniref:RNA polymerase sigma-70 factor n=1 Tax=Thermophagus sp. OGC60D27 TaxID=3458415 RepID=UPI004038442C